ncbi:MAG: hypothetical protein J7M05_00780 [Anaerolineae bacterium]|nr:hypothetical protein [Anaerolineae bacterium]
MSLGWGGALFLVFLLALGVRLYQVRHILYPAWVDSYHHTIITQIVLDTGRVPVGYRPFAPLDSFHYHFGFHAYSAFVGWITGLPAHRAVLLGGQVLNALTVPSLFFFVDRLTKDRRAALFSGAMAGLVCRMPAYYVNWGRYTQLAGQVLLPVALAFTVEACQAKEKREQWRKAFLASLLAGGLLLTHYRVAIFYIVGVGIFGLSKVLRGRRTGQVLLCLGAIGLLVLFWIGPWLFSLLRKTISVAQQVRRTVPKGQQYDYLTLEFVLGYGLRLPVLLLSGLAAIWLLARVTVRPLGGLILLWLAAMFFLANPVLSGIPSGFLPNGTVIVALYLPASLLVGLAVGDAWSLLDGKCRKNWPRWGAKLSLAGFGLLVLVASILGTRGILAHGLEPWRYLVSSADLQAMRWIEKNVPQDALFAVTGEFWLPTAVAGADAGLWLPYIAHRQTLIPPMIYISEADEHFIEQVNRTVRGLLQADSAQALARALWQVGAGYIYLGRRSPENWHALLEDSRYFQCLYAIDDVRVYQLKGVP